MDKENRSDKIFFMGKQIDVISVLIEDKNIVVRGKFLKTAMIKDEIFDNGIENPEIFIKHLSNAISTDIFVFGQKIPNLNPKYNYYHEMDNVAVLEVTSYDDWWNKKIDRTERKMVKKAERKGVQVKIVEIDNEFINGIKGIYDETPIRQGRFFWHYKKDFEVVKMENIPYLDRAQFVGAYYNGELIGFSKIVFTNNRADHIQLLSKISHRDKSPTNALIAKAVEICANKGIKYLTYGKYTYGNKGEDSLSKFKKRNGFEKICIPKYYIPLTLKGKIFLFLNLHKRFIDIFPPPVVKFLVDFRENLYLYNYNRLKS